MCTSAKMKRVTWSATWCKHGCTSLCSKDISKHYSKHHPDATIFRNSLCIFTKALFAIGCCWTQDKRPLEKVCSHFLQLQTYKLDCPVEQKYWWVWQFPLSVLKELEMVCFSRAFSTLTVLLSLSWQTKLVKTGYVLLCLIRFTLLLCTTLTHTTVTVIIGWIGLLLGGGFISQQSFCAKALEQSLWFASVSCLYLWLDFQTRAQLELKQHYPGTHSFIIHSRERHHPIKYHCSNSIMGTTLRPPISSAIGVTVIEWLSPTASEVILVSKVVTYDSSVSETELRSWTRLILISSSLQTKPYQRYA